MRNAADAITASVRHAADGMAAPARQSPDAMTAIEAVQKLWYFDLECLNLRADGWSRYLFFRGVEFRICSAALYNAQTIWRLRPLLIGRKPCAYVGTISHPSSAKK